MKIYTIILLIAPLLLNSTQAVSPSSISNLINPFTKSVGDFPFVKMTYGYETAGFLKGFLVEEDTAYSYTKAGGHKQPAKKLVRFEYYTEVKVDGRGNRAL